VSAAATPKLLVPDIVNPGPMMKTQLKVVDEWARGPLIWRDADHYRNAWGREGTGEPRVIGWTTELTTR
jgi:hypothetical protein